MKPTNEINHSDVAAATQRLLNAIAAVDRTPIHSPDESAVFDESATAAEELVVLLLRFHGNQRMISLALDEIAAVVREGY